jgi:hypothetical protein
MVFGNVPAPVACREFLLKRPFQTLQHTDALLVPLPVAIKDLLRHVLLQQRQI